GQLTGSDYDKAVKNYVKAVSKGVMKVMSKMGISTAQSYCGAQIFEAVGLNQEFIDKYFTWTPSRVGGIGIDVVAQELKARHERAFPDRSVNGHTLDTGGQYQYRREGEYHLFNPETVHKLQYACRSNNYQVFKQYSELVNNQAKRLCTMRGLFELKLADQPIPIEEVESIEDILKRFKSGAMSYGSISKEAHEPLGVGLISPPPHHDIYSIEDLAELIHDLKNSNRHARISVKLVAEVGVGTIAAGVAKAHADVVLISGHDGGTGASPLTSIKHAGAP